MIKTELIRENWRLFRRNKLGMIGLSILCCFALLALLAPVPPAVNKMYEPMKGVDPQISRSVPPGPGHLLGTDFMGRDIFSQLMKGAQTTPPPTA